MPQDDEERRLRSVALQTAESIRLARLRAERQAEAALREQANLLNLTHDAVLVRDMDGVITYWNRGAEDLYGWPAEQALGAVVPDLLKTVFPVPVEEIVAEVVLTGRWDGELVHTTRDGTRVVVASRWSLRRDDRGAPKAILCTNSDITERKRAEQALRNSEAMWRAAFEYNPTMYFMVDEAGTIVSVNPFGAEQLGYRVDELLGQPVLGVFYPPDREFVQQKTVECFQQPGRRLRWEARKVRKDGTLLWVRETGSAVVLKDRPVLLVVCEDITERRRAEEAVRRSEKELRDVIETMPAMVWVALADGTNALRNVRWANFSGLSSEKAVGFDWQAVIHPEDLARHRARWLSSLATGEPLEDEVRYRSAADGEYRWFLVRGVPLRDEHGGILKWYGVLTDIEDRKRAEALLAGEKRILEMVARGDSLPQILDALCRLAEEQGNGVRASIELLDGSRLRHGGAIPKDDAEPAGGNMVGPAPAAP